MTKNRPKYKRYQAPRLRFPTNLKFTTSGDKFLKCNGKTVQVIASQVIMPEDNPPVNFPIFGLGVFNFEIPDVDYLIFSFANVKTMQTDCAIIKRDELLVRLEPYHHEGDKINLKLILNEKGLHECYNAGGEAFFLTVWTNRDFSPYHNNWSVLKSTL